MGECFSQCFEVESPARLVRFLKLEWNISSTDAPLKFENMFVEKMTEPTCMGDERWHHDIGWNRMEWRCNATCQKGNLCHKHSVFDAYRNECEEACRARNGHHCWEACSPWQSEAVCTSVALREYVPNFNTTWIANSDGNGGQCEPSGLQTPCGCDHCYEPCRMKEACEATSNNGGGTFFTHSSNEPWGQCCPNGKFIHTRTTTDHNSNQVEYREECDTHCEEHVHTWESCEQCAETTCKHADCKACEEKSHACCGETLVTANKTACLRYTKCNDRSLSHRLKFPSQFHADTPGKSADYRNGAACGAFTDAQAANQKTKLYDNMGTCMQCWGNHCERRSRPLQCILEEIEGTRATKSSCESAGRTWLVHDWCRAGDTCHGECRDLDPSVVDATTCYQRNVNFSAAPGAVFSAAQVGMACSNASEPQEWRKNEIARRSADGQYHPPKYYLGEGRCSRGCYREAEEPTGSEQCANGLHYIHGADVCCKNSYWYHWESKSCKRDSNTCDDSTETRILNQVRYRPAKYLTEDECALGTCAGSLRDTEHFAIWSKEDCKAYSKPYCDRGCPKCVALGRYDPTLQNSVGQSQTFKYNSTGSTTYPTVSNGVNHIGGWEKFEWVGSNGACFDWSNNLVTDERYARGKTECEMVATPERCEAVMGCKERYQWGYTPKLQAKCSECGGDWEPQYYWKGGNWRGGVTEGFQWESQGVRIAPANVWTGSFSERKMKAELQKPLMKMFAETKKSQSLLLLNSYLPSLRTIACDCGIENFGSSCWEVDNASSVVSVGTSFCGNDANLMQGGCSKVEVKQQCTSRRRRRLLAAGGNGESLELSFGHISAGLFSQPICTETGSEETCTCTSDLADGKLETIGANIKNAGGVTIGQLAGDGIEFIAPNAFPDSIEKCLNFRTDIRTRRDLFNTSDIAKQNTDGSFVTLNYGDFGVCNSAAGCSSISQQKICFKATAAGKYFPILRRHKESSTDTGACSISGFNADRGVCLSGANEKRCFCGYYGLKCDKGCPNSCDTNNAKTSRCNANTHACTCPPTHTGSDCSLLDCASDNNGNVCYNHGTCKLISGAATHAQLVKHAYFTKFDANHDGLLDAHELKIMFWKRFGAITNEAQVGVLIAKFDGDNDGKLTEEEYQKMIQSLEDADTKHNTVMFRKILEELPETAGMGKEVEMVQTNTYVEKDVEIVNEVTI
eukprot:g4283.t1